MNYIDLSRFTRETESAFLNQFVEPFVRMATSLVDLDLCNDKFHQLSTSPNPITLDVGAITQFNTIFDIDDSPPLNISGKTWELLAKVLMGAIRLASRHNPLGYQIHFFHNVSRNQEATKDFAGAYELLRNHVVPLESMSVSPFEKEVRPFVEQWHLNGGLDRGHIKPLNLVVLTATQSFDNYFDLEPIVTQVINDPRYKMGERHTRIQICHVVRGWGTSHTLDFELFFARLRARHGLRSFKRPVKFTDLCSKVLVAES